MDDIGDIMIVMGVVWFICGADTVLLNWQWVIALGLVIVGAILAVVGRIFNRSDCET